MKITVNIDDIQYLRLDWNEIERMIDDLADKIRDEQIKPNVIAGVLRGGSIVASLLSDRLGIYRIWSIGAKTYERTGKRGNMVEIYQHLPTHALEKIDVLLIEDVIDTGTTITTILNTEIYSKKSRRIYTASLHIKPWTKYRPDMCMEETKCWIWYPWELYEVGRDIYTDLLKKHDSQRAKKILLEEFKIDQKVLRKIVKSTQTNEKHFA